MFDVISITIILIGFDFVFTGFLPVLFGLSPSIKEIDKTRIVMSGGVSQVQYPTSNKWVNLSINNISGIKLVLTDEALYIQNTLRTYAVKIPVKDMKEFSIMKKDIVGKVFGDRIEIKLASGEKFRFRSEEIASWQSALSGLKIRFNEDY